MYKPPENSNRVKAIKSKFEENSFANDHSKSKNNNNNEKNNTKENKVEGLDGLKSTAVRSNLNVTRQLSDPAKRNIKRTPAFRLDSQPTDEKDARLIQNRSRYLEKRRDSSTSRLIKNCDSSFSSSSGVNDVNLLKKISNSGKVISSTKISDLRIKFDSSSNNDNNKENINNSKSVLKDTKVEILDETLKKDLISSLYTEPIPKHLRPNKNNINKDAANKEKETCITVVKKSDKAAPTTTTSESLSDTDKENHDNSVNLFLEESVLTSHQSLCKNELNEFLTDTLKSALKKPLPPGPAPKKPPRTFTHTPKKDCDLQNNLEAHISSLNLDKTFTKKLNLELQKHHIDNKAVNNIRHRGDPIYMLDRLENALKNKKARLKRIVKKDCLSEDECDDIRNEKINDSLSFSKNFSFTNNNSLKSKTISSSSIANQKFNFNCLNSFGCTNPAYERIKEPNASFFVSYESKEEPVYAEPFEFRRCTSDGKLKNTKERGKLKEAKSLNNVRNSVHYASSPIPDDSLILPDNDKNSQFQAMMGLNQHEKDDLHIYDTTSFSSACTSDMESTVSTPSEENRTFLPSKRVKDMISVFEAPLKQVSKDICKSQPNKMLEENKKKTENRTNCEKIKEGIEKLELLEKHFKQTLGSKGSKNKSSGDSAYATWASHASRNKRGSATEITKKFEIYVKRVRSKVKSCQRHDAFKHLFECCLLVGLNRNTPYIKSKFPENVNIPHKIEELCFPDAHSESMDLSEAAQCYSLVITNENGERTFGYCRRVLPEGSNTCLPLAYCILSRHKAPGFYKKILQELESRHGLSEKIKKDFLNELYNSRFPKPGEAVRISLSKAVTCTETNCKMTSDNKWSVLSIEKCLDKSDELDLSLHTIIDRLGEYGTVNRKNCENLMGSEKRKMVRGTSIVEDSENNNRAELRKSCSSPTLVFEDQDDSLPSELVFIRPSDTRHEENNLQMLCHSLSTDILQQVFGSLLLQRKVVFVSSILSKISSCIEALQVTLYPFTWPHTLIPVLPQSLWEILEAPTPLICGVLSKEVVHLHKIENGMVVDLDDGTVLVKEGDEDKVLRWTLLETWKDGLSLAKSIPAHEIQAQNVLLSDAFLRVFIRSCGHYKNHIVDDEFQKASFIESGKLKGKGVRSFLSWFTETTMFCTFIETVLNDKDSFPIFDQRIEIYSSEAAGDILKKMKERPKEKSMFFRFVS